MKKIAALFLCMSVVFLSVLSLSGCEDNNDIPAGIYDTVSSFSTVSVTLSPTEETPYETTGQIYETTLAQADERVTTITEKMTVTETQAEKLSVEKDGSYTTPEDVAEYIHTFGTLPDNFITKSEARDLGWDSKEGNLWDVAEGKSIGGDRFGNYEGLLPEADGREYAECDINYSGGYRGGERLIFSNDGLIFYTNDHYKSFTQLY